MEEAGEGISIASIAKLQHSRYKRKSISSVGLAHDGAGEFCNVRIIESSLDSSGICLICFRYSSYIILLFIFVLMFCSTFNSIHIYQYIFVVISITVTVC